ncbi:hypothetical protein B0H14DRAFT_2566276 [Mycena olivaceomarginata]|nr:hypothetical protein B0H14DRAFT_2566276 [Mycena olivaceomarginata]
MYPNTAETNDYRSREVGCPPRASKVQPVFCGDLWARGSDMAVLDDAEGCERYSIDLHLQGYGVRGLLWRGHRLDGVKPENGGFNVVPSSRELIGKASGIEHKGLGVSPMVEMRFIFGVAGSGAAPGEGCDKRVGSYARAATAHKMRAEKTLEESLYMFRIMERMSPNRARRLTPVANWEAFSAADLTLSAKTLIIASPDPLVPGLQV